MTDKLTPEQRKALMRRVKNKDTAPEMLVRRLLHSMGFRFRLHCKDLPGTPDIVLPRYRTVVFVHGCFWHGHDGCRRGARPASNTDFWNAKIDRNRERDTAATASLTHAGWRTLIIWDCEAKANKSALSARLSAFVKGDSE
jgi:DNA mismatch endonuclease (patch repair protein)